MKAVILILVITCLSILAEDKAAKLSKNTIWKSTLEMHQFHIKEFVAAPDFGVSRILHITNGVHLLQRENKKYMLSKLELFSITDRKTPVMWPAKINKISRHDIKSKNIKSKNIKSRKLTKVENTSFTQLKKNRRTIITPKAQGMTILAALIAEPSCIPCHEDYKKDDFMGAFKYTLRPVRNK